MSDPLKSPYPYFGGKRKVAEMVWSRLGKVQNYVEPFFGSGAVLLGKPSEIDCTETVNDLDGFVSNFWRAIAKDPDATAEHADWPVNENDLHARHSWLVGQKESMQARLEGGPEYFDAKVAGWWVWGMACWIGSGFCSGKGPWGVREIDGVRQLVHLGDEGRGVKRKREDIAEYFRLLSDRFRDVRVCCGDWSRVCGPSVTHKHGLTGVFLDPPYSDAANRSDVYRVDCPQVAHAVREWALANGNNPLMRIALCGYAEEHSGKMDGWDEVAWNAGAGFGGQRTEGASQNGRRERIWFSPHCEAKNQGELF